MDRLKSSFKQFQLGSAEGPVFPEEVIGHQTAPRRHVFLAASVGILPERERPIRILEIGSWVGSSSLTLAQAADQYRLAYKGIKAELVCVDPLSFQPLESWQTREQIRLALEGGVIYELFIHNISFAPSTVRIHHLRGSSRDILPLLRPAYFDLIFIDGSHSYDNVVNDIREAKRLLQRGGIICGDDLEIQLHQLDPKVREIARKFINDEDASSKHFLSHAEEYPAFHEGVTFAVAEEFGEITEIAGFWLVREMEGEYLTVEFTGNRPAVIPKHLRESDRESLLRELRGAATN